MEMEDSRKWGGGWAGSWVGKVLASQKIRTCISLQNQSENLGEVAKACNPSTEEVEKSGSVGLIGQPG